MKQIDLFDNIFVDNFAGGGGAVCPLLAKALVQANLPEYKVVEIPTMRDLHKSMIS